MAKLSLTDFYNSSSFRVFAKGNPDSASQIASFLNDFCGKHSSVKGLDKTVNNLVQRSGGDVSKWMNILSELRVADYIGRVTNIELEEFNYPLIKGDADFRLVDTSTWEVMSYSQLSEPPIETGDGDLSVSKIAKRIRDKFASKEGLDYLVIDDIFNHTSQNEPFAAYLFGQADNVRSGIFKAELGDLLNRIMFLVFVEWFSPTIVYCGQRISQSYPVFALTYKAKVT